MPQTIAKFRKWRATVAGQTKDIYVLSTDVPDSIGGGGALQVLLFQSYDGDQLRCTDAQGNSLLVNKPTKLRTTITEETINGLAVSYTYDGPPAAPLWTRTAHYTDPDTGLAVTEQQQIVPAYLPNDPLYVTADKLDTNVDARAWTEV